MQGLTGVFSLKSQIAAQERRIVDLAASNTSLRKANAELITKNKDLSSELVELVAKNKLSSVLMLNCFDNLSSLYFVTFRDDVVVAILCDI